MLVPKLRFKEFNDDWKQLNLRNTFSYFSTNSLSRDQLCATGLIKNIHYGDIHKKYGSIVDSKYEISTFIKELEYNNKYPLCEENDLIFADASEDYNGIGKAIELVNIENQKIISGLHTILARDVNNLFSPKFKGYIFNSPKVHQQIRILANGFKVFGISKETINKINILVPSKLEQTKIANFLSLVDKKIELQTKKIEALKLYKKGLILYIKKENSNWKEYKINQIFNVTRGEVIPKKNLMVNPTGEYLYPVYSSQTTNYGILGYDKNYNFDGEYLTWTTDGANAGKVFYRNGKFNCTNVCGVLYEKSPTYTNELVAELLNYETPKYVSYVGNPKLMNNVMTEIKIKIPNFETQKVVSSFLEVINRKTFQEDIYLTKLIKLKKGLLQQMFV